MPTVRPLITRSVITEKNKPISEIKYKTGTVDIKENLYSLKNIDNKNTYRSFIDEDLGSVKINEVLPFRIRFYNVGITTTSSVAPIGIAIIGFNNYIL